MDYKEKYEQALGNLNKIKTANKDNKELVDFIEYQYPELIQNEDEKTRKQILNCFRTMKQQGCFPSKHKEQYDSWIAWLEKQGKQKPFDYEHANIQQSDFAPKAEPKFKVGDWIVYCNEDVDLITGIEETGYLINEGGYIPFTCQEDMRLWTIRYVKRGDILYEQETNSILLVHERSGNWLQTLCDYWMVKEKFHVEFPYENYGFVQKMSLIPATKEQRDLLFSKMKEAGYEWDTEKKELKKIEHKPTWSEEDNEMINTIIYDLERHGGKEDSSYSAEINWLKFLKSKKHIKYIDVEKLKNEIDKRIKKLEPVHPHFAPFVTGQRSAFKDCLSLIDSLQQKQSE